MTHHSRVAGVECGLVALLFSFSSSAAANIHQSESNYEKTIFAGKSIEGV